MVKQDRDCQCDIDGICSKTKNRIDDEIEKMDLDVISRVIIEIYQAVISVSPKETFVIYHQDKRQTILTLPTIVNFDKVFDLITWELVGVSKPDVLYLMSVFHRKYVESLKNG